MKTKKLIKGAVIASIFCVSIAIYSSCNKSNIQPTVVSEPTSTSTEPNKNQLSRNSASYTGEDIFNGIFFIKGKFKNEIASYHGVHIYNGLTQEQNTAIEDLHERIIAKIKVLDEKAFDAFKLEIQSGSAARTDAAMDRMAVLFYKAMSQMPEYGEVAKLNTDEAFVSKESDKFSSVSTNSVLITNPDLLCNNSLCNPANKVTTVVFGVAVVAIFAVAIHNTAAVTVNVLAAANAAAAVYLAVWKYKYFWSSAAFEVGPASDFPAQYRKLHSLRYEDFVEDIASIYQ